RVSNSVDLKDFSSGSVLRADFSNSYPRGYTDIYVSDNFIYTLYSGRSTDEFGNKSYMGNVILVFDWDGNPVKRYDLDAEISCFTIDPLGQKIYAISETVEPELLRSE